MKPCEKISDQLLKCFSYFSQHFLSLFCLDRSIWMVEITKPFMNIKNHLIKCLGLKLCNVTFSDFHLNLAWTNITGKQEGMH